MTRRRPTIPERLGSALAAVAGACFRHPGLALIVAAAMTVVGVQGARRLQLDTDLVHLLPRSFPSVQAMDDLEERFWGTGYVAVVAQGAEPEVLKRFADEVAPELAKLPTIRFVEYRRPVDFFRDHALYFLDVDDLELIRNRLEDRRVYEVKKSNPLFLGVEEEEDLVEPSLDFSDLRAEYAERLGSRFRLDGEGGTDGYYLDPDKRIIVLLAKPARRADDVGYANQVVEQAQSFIDGIDTARYSPELRVALSGRYKKKIDQGKQVIGDLKVASVLAFVLMVLYLGLHFRRAGAVALVFVPLFLGVIWTFGFAGLAFGQLNLLTGFIGAIQLGLGIDHGIHLLGRYDFERGRDRAPLAALEESFRSTGRAVAVAGLTTLVAFAGLGLSEYRAFHEFGLIAAFGMLFVISAYVLVLPALVALGAKLARGRSPRRGRPGEGRKPPLAARLVRWSPALFWLSAVAAAVAVMHVPDNRFNYDFASLEDSDLPAFRLDKEINRILGHSQTPTVVLTDSVAEEREVVDALRRRPEARPGADTTVQFVASVADLVPAEQARKREILAQIGDEVARIRPSGLEPEQREHLDDIRRMTQARPYTRADLPVEVRRQFQGPGAPAHGGFVLVFPSVSLADGKAVQQLARELRAVRLPSGEGLPLAGAAMVLADVLEMTKREAPMVIGLTVGLVFLVLLVLLRRLRDVALCMGAAAATLLVTTGVLPGTPVRFNYLNIILIPVLFGIAVDGSVHLLSRLRETDDVELSYGETARAIAGSILTTALGFGAFMMAHHPGLVSLGALAVLGLGVNLLVCLLLLPSLLALFRRVRQERSRPRWVALLATVGGAGYSPRAPGTVGTLAAFPLALLMVPLEPAWRGVVAAACVAVSLPIVRRYLRGHDQEDPQEVVLDELVGMLVAAALAPPGVLWIVAAVVLFRLFDILKPWPIGWVDRRGAGSLSVVGDDVLAGLLAGGLLLAFRALGITWGWWT